MLNFSYHILQEVIKTRLGSQNSGVVEFLSQATTYKLAYKAYLTSVLTASSFERLANLTTQSTVPSIHGIANICMMSVDISRFGC